MQREEDMSPYFDHELTAFPTSLFQDNFMCKSVKAQLAKSLKDSVDSSEHNRQAMHVLEGVPIAQDKVGKENVIPRGSKAVCVLCI